MVNEDLELLAPFRKQARKANKIASISDRAKELAELWNLPLHEDERITTYTDNDLPIESSWAGPSENGTNGKSIHDYAKNPRESGKNVPKPKRMISKSGGRIVLDADDIAWLEKFSELLGQVIQLNLNLRKEMQAIRDEAECHAKGGQWLSSADGQECVSQGGTPIHENPARRSLAAPDLNGDAKKGKTFTKSLPASFTILNGAESNDSLKSKPPKKVWGVR